MEIIALCPYCKKKLSPEVDPIKFGFERLAWYFIENAIRENAAAHKRNVYWACTNPKCIAYGGPTKPFWLRQTTFGFEPVKIEARIFGKAAFPNTKAKQAARKAKKVANDMKN